MAEKLSVKAMHTSRLDELEDELKVDKYSLGNHSDQYDAIQIQFLKLLNNEGFGDYLFLIERSWDFTNPLHTTGLFIQRIQELNSIVSSLKGTDLKESISYLLLELLCHLSKSLLFSASTLFPIANHQRKQVFTTKLISGELSKHSKDEMMDRFYGFMSSYVKDVLKKPFQLRKEDMKLIPAFGDDLYFLLDRIIKKPEGGRLIPYVFDGCLTDFILNKKLLLSPTILSWNVSVNNFELALKFCRDLMEMVFNRSVPSFLSPLMNGVDIQ